MSAVTPPAGAGSAPPASRPTLDELLAAIAALPGDWHQAGSLSLPVLRAIAVRTGGLRRGESLETGAGKSSLLLSHLFAHHTVFSLPGEGGLSQVRDSPLLRRETVTFVDGPTQLTLPRHPFVAPLDFALIDGPHAYPFPDLEYYFLYPHLRPGALLLIDDIHIPTIQHLFRVLREDRMFQLVDVVQATAFFERTAEPLFDPLGDGWWLQGFNAAHFPVGPFGMRLRVALKRLLPDRLLRAIRSLTR